MDISKKLPDLVRMPVYIRILAAGNRNSNIPIYVHPIHKVLLLKRCIPSYNIMEKDSWIVCTLVSDARS